ncbi:hypothetical protein AB3N60_12215 [Leptospira sp. WS39.C2]
MKNFLFQSSISNFYFYLFILTIPIYLIITNLVFNDITLNTLIFPNLIPFIVLILILLKIKNLNFILQSWYGLNALLSLISIISFVLSQVTITNKNVPTANINYISFARDLFNTILFAPLLFQVTNFVKNKAEIETNTRS